MKPHKHLGIWMDHSVAHLHDLTNEAIATTQIESEFNHEQKEQSLRKGEKLMHHKQQHQVHHYYQKLADVIKNYQDVVLFGPTTAKTELLNFLKSDHRFATVTIVVCPEDKMTEPQQHAFVKNYFSTPRPT